MPSIVQDLPSKAAELPPRKRWSRAECDALEAAGLLQEEHLELIEGELINKMGKKRPHTITLTLVADWLKRAIGAEFVNWETPVDVAPEDNPTSEPEPDVIVLQRPHWEYRTSNPGPSDVRLAVEISDSTLRFDLSTKAHLYARAGFVEYWVFDLSARKLVVHREPAAGRYQTVMAYSAEESVAPLAMPQAFLRVGDVLPTD